MPDDALRDILFAATRAPSGSNRQPFRFVVLTEGPVAEEAKRLIGEGARRFWAAKREADGYDSGSGAQADSPKARMARTMQHYVDTYESVPVLVLACFRRYRHVDSYTDGASVYPACQNLLLAARALGFGGVMTSWQFAADAELRALAPHPRRGRDHGHHHPRPAPGSTRPGAAPAAARAGLRGPLGGGPRLGGRPGRGRPHVGGAADPQPIESAVLRTLAEG